MECFTVYADEIVGRIDPFYYKEDFSGIIKALKAGKYQFVELGAIAGVQGGYAFSSGDYLDSDGIPLLRIQNISDEEVNLSETVYLPLGYKDKFSSFLLRESDIVIAMTGATIGKIGRVDRNNLPCLLNQRVGRFQIKDKNSILEKYLFSVLVLASFREQIVRSSLGGAQPNISGASIESIKIPLPPISIQNRIVQLTDNAYENKRQKETEAQQLIDSINDYVLSELGITHPPDEKKMCYSIYSDGIEGRFDPSSYHPKRIGAIKAIKSSKHEKYPLKNFVKFKREIITSGNQDVPYIGLENIESDTGLFIPSKKIKEFFGSAFQFNNGDILFPKLRPYLNKVYLAEFDGVCSTEFHVMESKGCNNIYLSTFLRSKIVVNQTSYLMTGNTLPRLQTIDVENLLIPVPSNEIQNKIAEEVKARMQKAEQLKKEAKEVLEEAKERVERIILGEEEI
jgi:restriction endonuclease S subunit